ncbi:DUF3863 domain-containing protein [Streptomyces hoynatensis]|uniref:DUF3863 domain-containing protein n=1 Tax=Streptomyces hoynatensis TaxID=1141874 RepID=A0A3A9YU72_9ACTN|nr:DUF3863 domain-containing protein [Streptomyces hoynatensis]RKN39490.1 DUF3863 domain-containing protein [Streptomyces hoynatensis]
MTPSAQDGPRPAGTRRLTINSVIRKYQIEATRDRWLWEDETELHSADLVLALSEQVRAALPGARVTWGFSWCALTEESPRYAAIRRTVAELCAAYGDEVTFVPGGYFANRYAGREQVAADIADALGLLGEHFDRPVRSLLAGFLSAANIERAGALGLRTVQGHAWSQYSVDMQDCDGSISYPYYPSRRHFLAPGRGADRLDVVNLDGWTVDLLAARHVPGRPGAPGAAGGEGAVSSRMGTGPIETLHRMPLDLALRALRATSAAHLGERNVARNGLGWLTTNYEIAEVARGLAVDPGVLRAFGSWLRWLGETWPDLGCPTMAEFGEEHRARHQDNEGLRYLLQQEGSGIGASAAGERVTWFMTGGYRLGVADTVRPGSARAARRAAAGPVVFDHTGYRLPPAEPQGLDERNWSLLGELNQKRTRPQDTPVPLGPFLDARPALAGDLTTRYADSPELAELLKAARA